MNSLRAVVFDMDGVIVDSEPLHERAFYDVMAELGYADKHGLNFADYVGLSDYVLWRDFAARNQPRWTVEELLEMKRRRAIELIRETEPFFPGVVELIARLSQLCPLAVASGSERKVIETVLSLRGLRSYFQTVVCAYDVPEGKPAPDIFLLAAKNLGIPPAECWAIEDSKPGITSARRAGMRVIAVTNTHPAEELGEAHEIAHNYSEVSQLLLGGRSS